MSHRCCIDTDDGEGSPLKKRLRESVPMLGPGEWGGWRYATTSPYETLAQYREQGRLFAVRVAGNDLYPRFQFAQDGTPLVAVADLLKVVPDDARGWPLLSWFEAPNVLLSGRKPSEVLANDPEVVRAAAASFYFQD
ncbi:MAG TPA: hypothetical protein VGM84_08780 [Steroidobacteraceae bacterium]